MEQLKVSQIELQIITSKLLKKIFQKYKIEKENNLLLDNQNTIINIKNFIKTLKTNMSLIDLNLIQEGQNYGIEIKNQSLDKKELNLIIKLLNEKIKTLKVNNKLKKDSLLNLNELPIQIVNYLTFKQNEPIHKDKKLSSIKLEFNKLFVETIDPFKLLLTLKYSNLSNSLKNNLIKNFSLNENLNPVSNNIFENLNQSVKETHITGIYFNYKLEKSELSSIFDKIENEIQALIDFSEFDLIPEKLINEFIKKIYNINSALQLLKDFSKNEDVDENKWIKIYIKLINDFLNEIPTIEGKEVFTKYIINYFNLSESKREILNDFHVEKDKNYSIDFKNTLKEKSLFKQQDMKEGDNSLDTNINDTINDEYLLAFI